MAVMLSYCSRCRSVTVSNVSNYMRRLTEPPAGHRLHSAARHLSSVRKTKSLKVEEANQQESSKTDQKDALRFNVARIQMIPEEQRQTLFNAPVTVPTPSTEKQCVAHLKSKGLWGAQPKALAVPHVVLPGLLGVNIDEHFRRIATEQTQPYVDALDKLIANAAPPFPRKWCFQPGIS